MNDKLRRLFIRQSELVERINGLRKIETRSTEQDTELQTAENEYAEVQRDLRAALADDGAPADSGENAERREIRSRATLAGFLAAYGQSVPVTGAEAEWLAAEGCAQQQIPWSMLTAPETRAVSPGPTDADTVANTAATIHPVYERTVGPYLGIEMPTVAAGQQNYPFLSTSLTGGYVAKGADVLETAAGYTVKTATPKRAGAAFHYSIHDAALYAPLETDLRKDLGSVVADVLDDALLNGDGQGANANGMLNQLTDPDAPTDVVTFDSAVSMYMGFVDAKYALDESGVRMLVGKATYQKLGSLFRGTDSMTPVSTWLREHTGGLRSSNRIAAPASMVQQAVVVRNSPDRRAVCPIWHGLEYIRDPYTSAKAGEVHTTVNILLGDVVILRPEAYAQTAFKVAA